MWVLSSALYSPESVFIDCAKFLPNFFPKVFPELCFASSQDLTLNSVQNLMEKYHDKNVSEEAARNWLGGFGVSQQLALEPLYVLSGGQKSRVALALLAFANPHILLMDEPTNHLDLDAIQALEAALTAFKGGVVLVSHDTHFIDAVCDEIWWVRDHRASRFEGDIHAFKEMVMKLKKAEGK